MLPLSTLCSQVALVQRFVWVRRPLEPYVPLYTSWNEDFTYTHITKCPPRRLVNRNGGGGGGMVTCKSGEMGL